MKKYGLQVTLTASKGNGDALAQIMLEAAQLISTAKGCCVYIISQEKDNRHSVVVTEVWDNQEDHDNSLKIEGVGALISRAMPLLGQPPRKGSELEVLGGLGIS